jgi:flagellar biosynthetic protein FlhB
VADDVEKTEQPTPKRRSESRREGQVAISQDSFIFANLLSVTLVLMMMGSGLVIQIMSTVRQVWNRPQVFDLEVAVSMLKTAFAGAGALLLPVFMAAFAGSVVIGLAQTRGNVSVAKLKPKLAKMNPGKNISRIVTKQVPIEVPKSILKLVLVGGMLFFAIRQNFQDYFGLSRLPLLRIIEFDLNVILKAYLSGCVVLLLIAIIDYGYQHWQTEKGMKMSKQEVKDEMRQAQGDPNVKARLRSLALERARTRMMEDVKTADVVVTNPDHISIAIQYVRGEMMAPKIVARGAGILAFRIRDIAREYGIPIVENRPLARALYRSVKVGQTIPEKLYQTVAEVLAYVYRLDHSRARSW